MSQLNPSQLDFSPLESLSFDNGSWAVRNHLGGIVRRWKHSPLAILRIAYEEKNLEPPEQFTNHWCNWCKFSARDPSIVKKHWTKAHKPEAGRRLCGDCYIVHDSATNRTHSRDFCPVYGSRDELEIRQWDQRELRYNYPKPILYHFLCPKELDVQEPVRREVEKLREEEFEARRNPKRRRQQYLENLARFRRELKLAKADGGDLLKPGNSHETIGQTLTRNIKIQIELLKEEGWYNPKEHDDPDDPSASLSKPKAPLTARQRFVYGFHPVD